MNKPQLLEHVELLQSAVNRLKEAQHRDYKRLKAKYLAAQKNLKENPDKCGGEEYIKGYMSGLIEGMALLGNHTSRVCAGE